MAQSYHDQVVRIKNKLLQAKEADKRLKVFGADRHAYIVHKPATLDRVMNFEQQYSVELPDCYKSFILHIGNGGTGYQKSAAGPSYGIYPFGEYVDELIAEDLEEYLKSECVIHPDMSDEYWRELTKNIDNNDAISDDDYDAENGKLFGGILPIGSQGCTYLHGLILNGPFKGKVVNLDMDRQKPKFTFENNFLDWYERWLDEIIDGTLLQGGPTWFGYGIGGNSLELLDRYQNAKDAGDKKNVLFAILNKASIDDNVYDFFEQAYVVDKTNHLLLDLLTKFNYPKARPHLLELSTVDFPNTVRTLRIYALSKGHEWIDIIEKHIESVKDNVTYVHIRKILESTNTDFGQVILPLLSSEVEEIRSSVINTLGNLKNKHAYIPEFIIGLEDSSRSVVFHTLGALYEATDPVLLPYYKKLIIESPQEPNSVEHHIQRYLTNNLKLFSLTREALMGADLEKPSKKWYEIWK